MIKAYKEIVEVGHIYMYAHFYLPYQAELLQIPYRSCRSLIRSSNSADQTSS